MEQSSGKVQKWQLKADLVFEFPENADPEMFFGAIAGAIIRLQERYRVDCTGGSFKTENLGKEGKK